MVVGGDGAVFELQMTRILSFYAFQQLFSLKRHRNFVRNRYSIYLQGIYGITRGTGFTSLEILMTTFDYSGSQISKMGVQFDAYFKTDQHML